MTNLQECFLHQILCSVPQLGVMLEAVSEEVVTFPRKSCRNRRGFTHANLERGDSNKNNSGYEKLEV